MKYDLGDFKQQKDTGNNLLSWSWTVADTETVPKKIPVEPKNKIFIYI